MKAIRFASTILLSRSARRLFRFSIVAVWVMLCCLASAPEGGAIATSQNTSQSIYVFGDSLSDTGNLFNQIGQPTRPYANGRFSNGLVWSDRLANQLQITLTPTTSIAAGKTAASINFAFGGATTGVDQASDRLGLQQQVSRFREQVDEQTAPNAVFFVWAGANDYLGGRSIDAAEPIANLRRAIEILIAAGARHVVVGNLPSLGQLPATRDRDSADALDRLTASHNQQVAALVAELEQQDGVTARLLDVNDLFKRAIAGEFSFSNVTEACLDRQTGTICQNPNEYLFWDGIHPTTAAHARISEAALPLSVVPFAQGEAESQRLPVRSIAAGLGVLAAGSIAVWSKKR